MSADRSIMQGRYRYLAGWVAERRDRRAIAQLQRRRREAMDLRQEVTAAILDAWRQPGALGGGSNEPLILPGVQHGE